MRKLICLFFILIVFFTCGCDIKTFSLKKGNDVPQTYEEYKKKNRKISKPNKKSQKTEKYVSSGSYTTISQKAIDLGIIMSEVTEEFYKGIETEKYSQNKDKNIVFYIPISQNTNVSEYSEMKIFIEYMSNNIIKDNEIKKYFVFLPNHYAVYENFMKYSTKNYSPEEKKIMYDYGNEFYKYCSFFCVVIL